VHGVIFTSLREYVTAEHGADAADGVFAVEGPFLLSEAYPDEQFLELLHRAATFTALTDDELLYGFGVFTGEITFARFYPAFFQVAASAKELLLTVEQRIHELVRVTIPDAAPPHLRASELGGGVLIDYSSPRRLCVLLRGLAEGTARQFRETTKIDETSCMHRGDASCRFEVRLSSA
jgi:hypothetical protein